MAVFVNGREKTLHMAPGIGYQSCDRARKGAGIQMLVSSWNYVNVTANSSTWLSTHWNANPMLALLYKLQRAENTLPYVPCQNGIHISNLRFMRFGKSSKFQIPKSRSSVPPKSPSRGNSRHVCTEPRTMGRDGMMMMPAQGKLVARDHQWR